MQGLRWNTTMFLQLGMMSLVVSPYKECGTRSMPAERDGLYCRTYSQMVGTSPDIVGHATVLITWNGSVAKYALLQRVRLTGCLFGLRNGIHVCGYWVVNSQQFISSSRPSQSTIPLHLQVALTHTWGWEGQYTSQPYSKAVLFERQGLSAATVRDVCRE